MSTLTRCAALLAVLLLSTSASLAQDFYLDSNGVTIRCENATRGDTGNVFDIEYLAVDDTTIRTVRDEGRDMGTICTSHVTTMRSLFQDLDWMGSVVSWDVSGVTDMSGLFRGGGNAFNQNIAFWDVSSVTTMDWMFAFTAVFNSDIGSWDVSNVKTMEGMFYGASVFNQDISNWDVSSVTDMYEMFREATYFDQDISGWDVSNVLSFARAFYHARQFDQPIGIWDVSAANKMSLMFEGASMFNNDLSSWDVSNVTDMGRMFFDAERFNQDISTWDVRNVSNMHSMFDRASSFSQDLSSWCVPYITSEPSDFSRGSQITGLPQWGCPVAPVSDPRSTQSSGMAPLQITLTGAFSSDANSDPLTYLWDLGDGTTSTDMVVSHTYPAGVYTITLTVSDGTFEHTAAIRIESINEAPAVDIQASSLMGQAPVEITFDGSGSIDANGDPITFAWDLGDGTTSTDTTVVHTYTAAGDYNVVLRVSDGLESASDSVTVSIASGVATEVSEVPERYELRPAYPNPFNPTTTLNFGLPAASDVRITATDLLGRQVATLVARDIKAAGYHTVQFNADGLASGTYLIRMEVGDFVATQQVVLLK